MMAPDSSNRFNQKASHYSKARPSYPDECVDWILDRVGFSSNISVADVGSGTGILTELFLKRGAFVFGVEPNSEMRAEAERSLLSEYELFRSVSGSAEETSLMDDSVQLVTVAQAYHWMDPEKTTSEFRRILQPGGLVALLWNDRQAEASEFMSGYEELLEKYGTEFEEIRDRATVRGLDSLFGQDSFEEFKAINVVSMSIDDLHGLVQSLSYLPSAGEKGFQELSEDLGRLFESQEEDGEVRFVYETSCFLGGVKGS